MILPPDKKIYLVRHAESEQNKAVITIGNDTALSEAGTKQAEFVGERFLNIPIDVIISSPLERTRKTAEAISRRTGKPIEEEPLITEWPIPEGAMGLPKTTRPKLIDMIGGKYPELGETETFEEMKERGERTLELLKNRPEKNIAVVTHGVFLYILAGLIIFKEKLTYEEYADIHGSMVVSNAGITIFTYTENPYRENRQWRIATWNDHAHL